MNRSATRSLLGIDEAALKARGGYWTAREIVQQPDTLRATAALIADQRAGFETFLNPLISRADLRVVLTGAGTSAFIGDSLARWLAPLLPGQVDALATTDITCAPHLCFARDRPTLLVSFARSGDSPESVATVDAAEALIAECHHLAITCNADGALAGQMAQVAHGRTLCLPPATHDRGFAMTSSYTAMTFAARALLGGIDAALACDRIGAGVGHVLGALQPSLAALAGRRFDRVVYLGSHVLAGAAREAALKLLELTDGQTVAIHDTPLGFRHGPKTFVTDRTLVVIFMSNDRHIRRYDLDLARELARDGRAGAVVALDAGADAIEGVERLAWPGLAGADDIDLVIPFVAAAQILALHASLDLGLTPDRPNRSGTVNRVVEGVTIHALA